MPAATRTLRSLAITIGVLSLAATPADAGIASTNGAIQVINHPTGTLNSGTLESDSSIFVWFERTIAAPGAQSLDHVGAGTVSNGGAFGPGRPSPGVVSPTVAQTYVIHFDQAGGGSATVSGATITFDRPIIGVWHNTTGLTTSDAQWAPAGLTYGTFTTRPYELGTTATSDSYSISADRLTLTILNTYSMNGLDQLRVLVNPEPSTLALMALGVVGLASLVRRRRRRRS